MLNKGQEESEDSGKVVQSDKTCVVLPNTSVLG